MSAITIHTTNALAAQRLWRELGGTTHTIPGTGELRLDHPDYTRPLRINNRRKDVPRVLLSRLNQLLRRVS